MKARLPLSREVIRRMDEYNQQESHNMTRRLLKVMAVSLNKHFGFGARRIWKVVQDMNGVVAERKNDPVFWEHVDKRVIDELKLRFEREDYKKMEEQ